jgi:acetate---CoA ligase (ADP-forming) subunit beta
MNQINALIENALKQDRKILSEYESKKFLASYGIPVTKEHLVHNLSELREAARQIGYPLAIKGSSSTLAHKTEQGLVFLDIRNDREADAAFQDAMAKMAESDRAVLVQELVKGRRELVAGMTRDPQFGPCVMFGLGGIFTEVLRDISFRVAPIEKRDAMEMAGEIKSHKILDSVRGMPAANMEKLCQILITVGRIGLENPGVKEIDINPLILSGGDPVAVDALVVLSPPL